MRSHSEWRYDLIERTQQHWDNGSALSTTEEYIRELLPEELKYAQQYLGLKQCDDCDTLVLLLGFSTDPLLQSIWVYQPRRIVLICNEKYVFGDEDDPSNILTGRQWAEHFRRYIDQLRKQGLYSVPTLPNFDSANGTSPGNGDIAICDKDASPDWVFRQLCERIIPQRRQASDEERKKKVVVDITGAKKNMMAGAFLFADYAGAKISYVDFDEYDARRHRPYGFTCRIGEQPNPYRMLSLRDWTRVRNLYEHFFFRTAAEEVATIEKRMHIGISLDDKQVPYFDDQQRAAVKTLEHVFRLLESWDNGDYTAAYRGVLQPGVPQFPLPPAVERLGKAGWPSAETVNAQTLYDRHRRFKLGVYPRQTPMQEEEKSIFERLDILLAYTGDELAKIHRLICFNEDYRSAFLRAAALDEFLLKARVALLWRKGKLDIHEATQGRERRPVHPIAEPEKRLCIVAIADCSSAKSMREFLEAKIHGRNPWLSIRTADERDVHYEFKIKRKSAEADKWKLASYWTDSIELKHHQMPDLRNEAIHTHLSLPREVAQAAYTFAASSLDDFLLNWVHRLDQTYQINTNWSLKWEALCHACGVTFLPPIPEEEAQ